MSSNCGASKPTKIMRLVYFDEAGTGSIADEPMTVVAAVIVHADKQWSVIEERLQSIIANLVPEESRADFEFHAKELFSGGGKTQGWGKEMRWNILTTFLETFDKVKLPVVWAGAERTKTMQAFARDNIFPELRDDELPHLAAFFLCQAQIELWFRYKANDEKCICIADPVQRRNMQTHMEGLQQYARRSGFFLPAQNQQFKNEHIIEAVSFVDSHKSIGVQLSDACNFFIKRHESGKQDSEHFYELIAPWIQNMARMVHPDFLP